MRPMVGAVFHDWIIGNRFVEFVCWEEIPQALQKPTLSLNPQMQSIGLRKLP